MNNNYISNGYWLNWVSFKNMQIMGWKLHIFADNLLDYWKIKAAIIPYLQQHNISHKFIEDKIFGASNFNSHPQFGKAITIYPPSIEMFKSLVEYLDHAFFDERLNIKDKKILGDKPIGKSGRIFYRYDLNTKALKDKIFEFSSQEDINLYDRHYENNRGEENHLAEDMTAEDDIICLFNIKTAC